MDTDVYLTSRKIKELGSLFKLWHFNLFIETANNVIYLYFVIINGILLAMKIYIIPNIVDSKIKIDILLSKSKMHTFVEKKRPRMICNTKYP